LEWLVIVEFAFNNKVYTVIKLSLFKVNFEQELRIGFEIKKKGEACEGREVCEGNEDV